MDCIADVNGQAEFTGQLAKGQHSPFDEASLHRQTAGYRLHKQPMSNATAERALFGKNSICMYLVEIS